MTSNADLPDIGTIKTAHIAGLSIRYAVSGASEGIPVLLTAPWPESIYAFHRVLPGLASQYRLLVVDLPGYGLSQSRPEVMAPEAMGDFIISLLQHFRIARTHVVAPDVGTPAVLFAAAKQQSLFESLVVGGGAMRVDLAAGQLKDLIHTPPGALAHIDGAEALKDYLTAAARLTPEAIIADFRQASAGRRLEDATQFVRKYIPDLPKLELLLPKINTPVLVVAGKADPIVPPSNGQFLTEQLPHSRYTLLDGGHRIWEEATAEYVATVRRWLDGEYWLCGTS